MTREELEASCACLRVHHMAVQHASRGTVTHHWYCRECGSEFQRRQAEPSERTWTLGVLEGHMEKAMARASEAFPKEEPTMAWVARFYHALEQSLTAPRTGGGAP